uniref:Myosin-binding domain-containing protein n=1 Tax=Mycena chlorophos TaxID=658473 RepID=A0ABQ0LR00_MYCCL|nr:predicted protein [Mycena chlorophos]
MAQPRFDDHPLEQYLRAAGEPPELMPGSLPEPDPDFDAEYADIDEDEEQEWRPAFLVQLVGTLQTLFPRQQESRAFAERFKYDVISSTLLESCLPTAAHSHRQSASPTLPGKLKLDIPPHPEPVDYSLMSLVFFFAAVFLATGTYVLAFLFLGGGTIHLYTHSDNAKPDMAATMAALTELISANDLWDSVVQDTVTLLEKEEESNNPPSPVSSVRLAIHSSLHTTQTQCDNVRQLLSALTAPVELAQLSEMYAPPSPRHSIPPQSPVKSTSMEAKRTTWNGSYSGLYNTPMLNGHQKRRSDLSLLFTPPSPNHQSYSAPNTPPATALGNVPEEGHHQPSHFGAAALELHRRRRVSGMDAFRLTPPRTPITASSTVSHASRFTTMQTMRHPLGLSALYHTLEAALASKRYACSHLLALRFEDEDDEGYWEDVRSVMALLTTTFSDAAARLSEALEDAERQDAELCQPEASEQQLPLPPRPALRTSLSSPLLASTSFAPVPSHITRFAAHVDAISSALDDAREHLADCVAAIREGDAPQAQPRLRPRRSRTFSISRLSGNSIAEGSSNAPEQPEPRALQAYERLRRELGLALRECERGRDRLLDLVTPKPPPLDPTESEEEGDNPGMAPDASDEADESDKPDSGDDDPPAVVHTVVVAPEDGEPIVEAFTMEPEPPGVEQVFESDVQVGVYTRERSKLTREERIRVAKARREQQVDEERPQAEKWGPGGEVVQELKDVIWKVGERRRKMTAEP